LNAVLKALLISIARLKNIKALRRQLIRNVYGRELKKRTAVVWRCIFHKITGINETLVYLQKKDELITRVHPWMPFLRDKL
jgi:hypothetical protein